MVVAMNHAGIDYQNEKVGMPLHRLHIQGLMGRYDETGCFEQYLHDRQARVKQTSVCGVP